MVGGCESGWWSNVNGAGECGARGPLESFVEGVKKLNALKQRSEAPETMH